MSWLTVPASELMLKRGGSVDPSKFLDETFELLSIPAFDKNQPEILLGSEIGSSKSCIEPNDVLLSKIVPHIRRCWVVPPKSKHRQIGSGEWIIFRDDRFYSNFLRHFLTSDIFHSQFMNTVAGVGGSLVRARPSAVERIEIPLPPLPEQQRIAAILDKADAIRRKRQQAIQLADEFLRSVFLEMFGDPVTNPKGWEVKLCTDICRQITVGLVIKPASYYVDEGIPAIRSLNIGDKGIKRENFVYFSASDNETVLSKSRVYEDDIVIVRSGQPGKAAVIPKELDGINAIDVLIVRPDKEKIEPNFLAFFLNSSAGKSLVMSEERGQVQKHLNVGSLNVAKIPIPPIDRQRQFVKIIKKIRDISEKSKLAECDVMFNALSQRAFAGEL